MDEVTIQAQQAQADANGNVVTPPTTTQGQGQKQPDNANGGQQGGNVVTLPTKAMAALKREERLKGQRELAKRLGFASVEDMEASFAAKRNEPKPAAQTETKPSQTQQNHQRQTAKPEQKPGQQAQAGRADEDKIKRLAREKAKAEREAREARREALAAQAEAELRIAASNCGIRDVDYALHLVRTRTKGLTEEQLRKFDEVTFFNNLRTEAPYIFRETVVPAQTGVSENAAATKSPPSAGTANERVAQQNGARDALKMKPDEYKERLRSLGLTG
jgi:hypothetical protein